MRATLTRRAVLLAGGSLPALAGAARRVRVVVSAHRKVSFLLGDRPLFEYCYAADRPKTYVHPLYAPGGVPLTLDGPKDHVHHRGVMLAWSDVQGFDFWGEVNPGPPHGQIVHQRFESVRERPVASVTAINHWIGAGKLLVIERQTVRAPVPTAGLTWLEWESELRPARDAVILSAKGHPYDGLGVRFIASMDRGRVLNAKGTREIAQANGQEAAWCAYAGALPGGGFGGTAIFDHPGNPRHPTPFFVMNQPFGYLSAAPTFRDPFQLRAGERLRLRYAVVSFQGEPDRETLDRHFQLWSKQAWKKS